MLVHAEVVVLKGASCRVEALQSWIRLGACEIEQLKLI